MYFNISETFYISQIFTEKSFRRSCRDEAIAEAAGPPMRVCRHGKPRPAAGGNAEGFRAGKSALGSPMERRLHHDKTFEKTWR